jgi:hypothetical protein
LQDSILRGQEMKTYPVIMIPAHVAQSVEHILGKDEVTSSILVVGSISDEKGLL